MQKKFGRLGPLGAAPAVCTVNDIKWAVVDHYGLMISDLYLKSHSRRISRPRQIAVALAYELTPNSLTTIARLFKLKDHSSVHYARLAIAGREDEKDFMAIREKLTEQAKLKPHAASGRLPHTEMEGQPIG